MGLWGGKGIDRKWRGNQKRHSLCLNRIRCAGDVWLEGSACLSVSPPSIATIFPKLQPLWVCNTHRHHHTYVFMGYTIGLLLSHLHKLQTYFTAPIEIDVVPSRSPKSKTKTFELPAAFRGHFVGSLHCLKNLRDLCSMMPHIPMVPKNLSLSLSFLSLVCLCLKFFSSQHIH